MTHTYQVEEPDTLNPSYPVVYTLEVYDDETRPVLTQDQPGPFMYSSGPKDMFIDLEALVKLGNIAARILRERAS